MVNGHWMPRGAKTTHASRLQLTTPLLLRGYFFLTSRFESSEAGLVLGILDHDQRDALSDSLSNQQIQINKNAKGLSENSDLRMNG